MGRQMGQLAEQGDAWPELCTARAHVIGLVAFKPLEHTVLLLQVVNSRDPCR